MHKPEDLAGVVCGVCGGNHWTDRHEQAVRHAEWLRETVAKARLALQRAIGMH